MASKTKTAKTKATAETKTDKNLNVDDKMKITVLNNPFRDGTANHQRASIARNGMLVKTWRKKVVDQGLAKNGWGHLKGLIEKGAVAVS